MAGGYKPGNSGGSFSAAALNDDMIPVFIHEHGGKDNPGDQHNR